MTIVARRSPNFSQSFGALVPVDVLSIQCGLWQLGFDPGRFDGLWGPMTEGALNRWYAWWRSRQVSAPEPVYEHPPVNRGGAVRIPEEWTEIPAAALRGRCAREPRGAHQPPPVPEPQPLAPPSVIVGPDGAPEPDAPRPVVRAGAGKGAPLGWLLAGGLLIGAAAYYARRDRADDFRMPPLR